MQRYMKNVHRINDVKRLLIVLFAYISGVLFGFFVAWLSHMHTIAHPHQIPAGEIILHNVGVVGMMLLGVLTFGIVTFGVLFINGALLGATMGICATQGKLGILLLALAPYGILEVSAFLLVGYGCFCFVSCFWYMLRAGHRNCWDQKHILLRNGLLCHVIALGMLMIAGYLEHVLFFIVTLRLF
jgi:uncharacterized membrane protein SpoIIM required for sporulation